VDVKKTIIMSDMPIMLVPEDDELVAEGIAMLLISILKALWFALWSSVSLCRELNRCQCKSEKSDAKRRRHSSQISRTPTVA